MSGEARICGAEQTLFGVQCQLPLGHDDPHRHKGEMGTVTWEPKYVGELRRELDMYRDALEGLAYAAREFSTSGDYRVERAIEEEFTDALEFAEKITAPVPS